MIGTKRTRKAYEFRVSVSVISYGETEAQARENIRVSEWPSDAETFDEWNSEMSSAGRILYPSSGGEFRILGRGRRSKVHDVAVEFMVANVYDDMSWVEVDSLLWRSLKGIEE